MPNLTGVFQSQVILIFQTICRLFVSVFILAMCGRYLTVENIGVIALLLTLFAMTNDLLDSGTNNLAVRDIVLSPRSELSVLSNMFTVRFFVACLAGLLGLVIFFATEQVNTALVAFIICLPLFALSAFIPVFQVRQQHFAIGAVYLLLQISSAIAVLVLINMNVGVEAFVYLLTVRELIYLFLVTMLARHKLGRMPWFITHCNQVLGWLKKSMAMIGAAFFYRLYFHGGMIWVWLFLDAFALGQFGAVHRILAPFLVIPSILMVQIIPVFTYYSKVKPEIVCKLVQDTLEFLLAMLFPLLFVGLLVVPLVLDLMYAGAYTSQTNIQAFCFLLSAAAVSVISNVCIYYYLANKQDKFLLCISVFLWLGHGIVCYLLFFSMSYVGAAVATLVAEICMTAVLLIQMGRLQAWRFNIRSVIALACGLIVILCYVLTGVNTMTAALFIIMSLYFATRLKVNFKRLRAYFNEMAFQSGDLLPETEANIV